MEHTFTKFFRWLNEFGSCIDYGSLAGEYAGTRSSAGLCLGKTESKEDWKCIVK